MNLGKLVGTLMLGLAIGCSTPAEDSGNIGQCKEGRVWYNGECCPDDNDNGVCDWIDDGSVPSDAYSSDAGVTGDTGSGVDSYTNEDSKTNTDADNPDKNDGTNCINDDCNGDLEGLVSPKIIFISDREGYKNVWMMNPDGTQAVNMTNCKCNEESPIVTKDGKSVIFVRQEGSNKVIMVKTISPTIDNTVNLTEANTNFYSPSIGEGSYFYTLAGSDGTGNSEIYLLTPNNINLTNNLANDWDPDLKISPNLLIAFSSDRDGNPDIYTMGINGENPKSIFPTPFPEYKPRWSPDGTKILYESSEGSNSDIFFIDLTTAPQIQMTKLTQTQGFDGNARWSFDGQKIVFRSQRDGNPEIYVMNKDGTNPINLSNHPGGDYEPFFWTP